MSPTLLSALARIRAGSSAASFCVLMGLSACGANDRTVDVDVPAATRDTPASEGSAPTPDSAAPPASAPPDTTDAPDDATQNGDRAGAHVFGAWSAIGNWPFIPIHAALLPDGRLMTYGSTPNGDAGGHLEYDIWAPNDGLGRDAHLTLPNSTAVDTFCSAGLLMPQSGNFLTASGDWRGRPAGFTSNRNKDVLAFDYRDNGVKKLARSINRQRWYGTMTMMPSGEVLMQGGTCWLGTTNNCDNGQIIASTPEVYRPHAGWQLLEGARSDRYYGETGKRWWYPRSWVAPDGRVFGISGGTLMYYLDTNGHGEIADAGSLGDANRGNNGSAVMFRPGKILIVGGGAQGNYEVNPNGLAAARVVDINQDPPLVQSTEPLNTGRQWLNATVMADGRVAITGGALTNNTANHLTLDVAIWSPDTGQWTYGANARIGRLYHSSAVLLADGRIWTGGGGAPGPFLNKNAEVYSPPYLFNADDTLATRPQITSAPATIGWGNNHFNVTMSNNEPVTKVSLVAAGSATHSFDMNQRFMTLSYNQTGNTLLVSQPPNPNVAPPGYYLVFVFNQQGVPSVAKIVRLVAPSLTASPDQEIEPIGQCNELFNPDFELGQDGWDSTSEASIIESAFQGKQALRFTDGSIGHSTRSATSDQRYTVSGFYQASGVTGDASFGLEFYDAFDSRLGQTMSMPLSDSAQFTEFSLDAVTPANTTRIRLWIHADPGRTLTIDNVSLGPTDCR